MKNTVIVSTLTLAAWLGISPCHASSYGPALIEQPVNFGPKSDPQKIPLGDVAVVCNYDYGLHAHIGDSIPCPGGAMRWESGTELDQNLASVFGISVEAEDSTQIRAFPVTLRMNSWKPPGYSPYTKEQVLAATLWCLIRRAGGTPEQPLDVRVVAEGPEDKPLEAKYTGKYINQTEGADPHVPPVNVPGTVIETDSRGIAWVVFPNETRKAKSPPPTPTMKILPTGGESDPGWYLLPEWSNGNDEDKKESDSASSRFQRLILWLAMPRISLPASEIASDKDSSTAYLIELTFCVIQNNRAWRRLGGWLRRFLPFRTRPRPCRESPDRRYSHWISFRRDTIC